MLKKNPINAYYFSGTGNTEKLATHFINTLRQQGFETSLQKMEDSPSIKNNKDNTLGLMFPVAIQSTYPIVWDFIKKLPPGEGRNVFMFDTNTFRFGNKKVFLSK